MTLRYLSLCLLVGAFALGCKPAEDASAAPAATKPSAAPAKPADLAKPTDAAATAATTGENSVVGIWKTDNQKMPDGVIEFKDDGTAIVSGPVPGLPGTGITMASHFTYKADGDKLTLTQGKTDIIAPPDAEDKVKKTTENVQKGADETKPSPPIEGTVAWKGKDSFTFTTNGKVTTYTRKS